jgi:hypothetical protein
MKSLGMLLRIRLLALLTALAIALPLGAGGRDLFFCHVMGRTLSSCCCPRVTNSSVHVRTATDDARAEKSNCCTVVDRDVTPTIPGIRDEATRVQASLAATRVTRLDAIPEPNIETLLDNPVRARAPPASGPALFLKHCALLS